MRLVVSTFVKLSPYATRGAYSWLNFVKSPSYATRGASSWLNREGNQHAKKTNKQTKQNNHYPYKSIIPPRRSTQLEGTLDWGDLKRYDPNSLPTWQGPHHFLIQHGAYISK
ncbi:hypothetical protein Hanom_Chr00s100019g01803341 [Helianthus anomalus]